MLIQGDARCLPLADGCVQMVVTSPPYFNLRDYANLKQIGLETTPVDYVTALLEVFAEVWRVLKSDGTLWLNLGDSYAAGGKGGGGSFMAERREAAWQKRSTLNGWRKQPEGCKEKDLLGIPWMVAFALRDAGWYLRSDIIWSKPNPMPESVTDRPTKAHEYLFLLSKSERYFYDAEAIMEPVTTADRVREVTGRGGKEADRQPEGKQPQQSNSGGFPPREYTGKHNQADAQSAGRRMLLNVAERRANGGDHDTPFGLTRNRRSVWEIPTQPYAGAHFATFPEALVEPCVLAGSRLGDVVLDPFIGSGTVGFVSERLGRRWVGIDLAYHALAAERTAQRGLPLTHATRA